MDKLLRFFPHFLIFSLLIRILVVGASFGEALVMLVFGAIYGGHEYLVHLKQPEANQDLKDRLKTVEESQELLKNRVSSVVLGAGLRK